VQKPSKKIPSPSTSSSRLEKAVSPKQMRTLLKAVRLAGYYCPDCTIDQRYNKCVSCRKPTVSQYVQGVSGDLLAALINDARRKNRGAK